MNKNLSRFSVPAFFLFIFIKAFAGPIGMISPIINYLGVMVMFFLLIVRWVSRVFKNPMLLFFSAVYILYAAIGLMYFSIFQVMFSMYMFIPFLFCVAYSDVLIKHILQGSVRLYFFLGMTCAIGILYVNKFGAPWLGNVLNVGGREKVLSRDWTASGILRNPGFTAASFDAATLLMICSFFVLYYLRENKKYIMYLVLSIVTIYPIYLTTTKTTIITYLILVFIMILPALITNYFAKVLVVLSVLFTYFFMLPSTVHQAYDVNNTFFMRMYSTWPDAVNLLSDGFSVYLGKGFGAIGTPALLFSPKEYNPADNAVVYLYIIGGFTSVVLVALLLFKYLFSSFSDLAFKRKYYLFSFCIFIGGLTYNLFESVFYAPFLGVVIGVLLGKNYCSLKK